MKPTRSLLPLLLLASQALPQQFVVDPANGPGTNFVDLAAAIAAVPDGSILIVRAGFHPAAVIDGKALTILADAGAYVQGGGIYVYLTIRNTAANQPVYVRGLRPWGQMFFHVENAAGFVCIDGQGSQVQWNGFPLPFGVTVTNSAQVLVRSCSIHALWPTTITASDVVFQDCTLRGLDQTSIGPASSVGPSAALSVDASRVQLVNCSAIGGAAWTVGFHQHQPAIVLAGGSDVQLMGYDYGYAGGNGTTAIVGVGAVRHDPGVTFSSSVPTTSLPVPMMVSLDGDSGGLAAANCRVTTNDAFVVLFGLPGPVVDLPGLFDGPLWIDLQACFVHAASVGPATFPVQLPLPPAVVPTGLQFVWQAVMLSPSGLVLSNPSPSVVL